MNIKDIFKLNSVIETIEELKSGRGSDLPGVAAAQKALDPKKHDVYDKFKRPDDTTIVDEQDELDFEDDGDEKKKRSYKKVEPVARIAIALQKLIIGRISSFFSGTPSSTTPKQRTRRKRW